ncbi:hypothetical protein B0T14DRAFT_235987 [Immersiella caudata]|uniref:Uncharacterized protein n=1 Tax=Immersiella caudata TaxID=314043 RepID=A0AA40C127_9PEZI|nr:hypothetical protein B0T14DRAFT_235987 [Immersiella caudata]
MAGKTCATAQLLPTEIWLSIIENLYESTLISRTGTVVPYSGPLDLTSYSRTLRTFSNLCLTCQRLRDFAQPLMYREFAFGYGQRRTDKLWEGRLVSLATTLATRHDLAAQMTHVFLDERLLHGALKDDLEPAIQRAGSALAAPMKLPSPASSVSPGPCQWRRAVLLLSLTLRLMPNLTHIAEDVSLRRVVPKPRNQGEVYGPEKVLDEYVRSALDLSNSETGAEDCGRTSGVFRQVKSLEFMTVFKPRTPLLFTSLRSWNVETLTLRGGFHAAVVTAIVASVKNLRIMNYRLRSPQSLEPLLAAWGSLESFYLDSIPTSRRSREIGYIDPEYDSHITPAELVDLLSKSCQALRHLHLDLSFVDFQQATTISLNHFTKMHTLTISANSFGVSGFNQPEPPERPPDWLTRALPGTIEVLTLLGAGYEFPKYKAGLLALRGALDAGSFPSLKRIRLAYFYYPDFWGPEDTSKMRRFLDMFAGVDVKVTIRGSGCER